MDRGVVIVGGGIAGQAVCEALRERDRDVAITLVCGETSAPYDRVRLSEILVSGEDPQTLGLRPAEWYADNDVELLVGRTVTWVDNERGVLGIDDTDELGFTQLVIATGSQPLMPPIPGIGLEGVHPFRDPADCEAIRRAAASGIERAAVIGGGLLGLEAARGIAAQGCAVTVVHLLDRLMERQLDAGASSLLAPALAGLDIDVEFDRNTQQIIGPHRAHGLRFTDGSELLADLVVVSIGIRPETELARSMDIVCDRGIIVDDAMRTSLPGVLAVGECAQHRGIVYGLVAPIYDQARVAAATLTGAGAGAGATSTPARTRSISAPYRARSSRSPGSTSSARASPAATSRPSSPTRRPGSTASSPCATAASSAPSCSATRAARRRSSPRYAPASRSRTRSRRSPTPRSPGPPTCPTRRRSATATASARATSSPP